MNGSGKHSSLMLYEINYVCKKFYSIAPCTVNFFTDVINTK